MEIEYTPTILKITCMGGRTIDIQPPVPPKGWHLLAFKVPKKGEHYLDPFNEKTVLCAKLDLLGSRWIVEKNTPEKISFIQDDNGKYVRVDECDSTFYSFSPHDYPKKDRFRKVEG